MMLKLCIALPHFFFFQSDWGLRITNMMSFMRWLGSNLKMKVSRKVSQKRVMEAKLEKRILKVKIKNSGIGNASFSSETIKLDNGEESE